MSGIVLASLSVCIFLSIQKRLGISLPILCRCFRQADGEVTFIVKERLTSDRTQPQELDIKYKPVSREISEKSLITNIDYLEVINEIIYNL